MSQNQATISKEFKNMTVWAVISIAFFLIIYLLLIGLSLVFIVFTAYIGMFIIEAHPSFATIIIGIGILSMAVLILIFLVKFIFKKHQTDRSNLIEITEADEPKLFAFIRSIVDEVKTDFPKKVYLSADVNAAVFYDSSFWSMFLPVKKNLLIGVGLINSVTLQEFKAILSHEFGHFSQRSMKVGSYVYNVNQIIYNLLNENNSYNNLAQQWANLHGFIAFFVIIAVKIIELIQSILRFTYGVVNKAYMALSREMEFHADEVAAHVAGSSPLITSLLRLDLASHSFDAVIGYYNQKVDEAVTTDNIYPQQFYVMDFLAKESHLPLKYGLPDVSLDYLSRFNKSKLVIKDQWASHPSNKDRIERLKLINSDRGEDNGAEAKLIFSDINRIQKQLTDKLFSEVNYARPKIGKATEQFIEDYNSTYTENSFHPIFKEYYDNKNPSVLDLDSEKLQTDFPNSFALLFHHAIIEDIYTNLALENDLNSLNLIMAGGSGIKTFDYDGKRYKRRDCKALIGSLTSEKETISARIKENDQKIFRYFYNKSKAINKEDELLKAYSNFNIIDSQFDEFQAVYIKVVDKYSFLFETVEFALIESRLIDLKPEEVKLKDKIQILLNEPLYNDLVTGEIRENFELYVKEPLRYFKYSNYVEENIEILLKAVNDFNTVIVKNYFKVKKELLDFQASIELQSPGLNQ